MTSIPQDIRLTPDEVTFIRRAIRRFDPEAEIILFGSRTDPTAKGGDIDLLVVFRRITPEIRRQIRVDLLLRRGGRKIDLIVTDDPERWVFTALAHKYGVRL